MAKETEVIDEGFFSKKDLKSFVIKLRKKHQSIEEKQFFCKEHNFNLESDAKKNEAKLIMDVIHKHTNKQEILL